MNGPAEQYEAKKKPHFEKKNKKIGDLLLLIWHAFTAAHHFIKYKTSDHSNRLKATQQVTY